jgi:hypothetical protein
MSADEYNGWTNRETWAVALWINNEQGWQEQVLEMALLYIEGKREMDEEPQAYAFGEDVRENVESTLDELLENGSTDAYKNIREDMGSLWRVDWTEIGAHFLQAADEQAQR